MTRTEAERGAKKLLMSGVSHHSYEDERRSYNMLFAMERDAFMDYIRSQRIEDALLSYAGVLGPNRLRGLRNAMICLITPLCRLAIDRGADVELCFSLSDYYINYLEGIDKDEDLFGLTRQILLHYYDLVQNEERRLYSKPVASAVRYVDRNLYGPCPVSAVAAYVGLEQHYFSSLFSKQVGLPPSQYILHRKLEESKYLLSQLGISVTEVAEALCFCDVAHFSRCFKKAYGMSPSLASRIDMPRQGHRDVLQKPGAPYRKRSNKSTR